MKQKRMVIIFGVNLQRKKKIKYALPELYGIGVKTAENICKDLGLAPELRVEDLTDVQQFILSKKVKEEYNVENNLQEKIKGNIQRYISNGSVRGFRHKNKLPVRGQRTHSNARTSKRVVMGISSKQRKI
jgi:small subunit ribosomal protein S13